MYISLNIGFDVLHVDALSGVIGGLEHSGGGGVLGLSLGSLLSLLLLFLSLSGLFSLLLLNHALIVLLGILELLLLSKSGLMLLLGTSLWSGNLVNHRTENTAIRLSMMNVGSLTAAKKQNHQ